MAKHEQYRGALIWESHGAFENSHGVPRGVVVVDAWPEPLYYGSSPEAAEAIVDAIHDL